MSLYRISLILFLAAIGFLFIFDEGRSVQMIAGIAALVCAALLVFGEADNRTS